MKNIFKEDHSQGFALVITLVVLILLTIILLTSLNSSLLEIQIAGNDRMAGEIEFAATACARLKTKELIGGSGPVPLNGGNPVSLTSRLQCTTNTPRTVLYTDKMPGYEGGSQGFEFSQVRFNSFSNKLNARGEYQALAQLMEQK